MTTTKMRALQRSDAAENRARILRTARTLFAEHGLDVPLRVVASRSRVSAATLYRHFPTKDQLLTEAFAPERHRCEALISEGLVAPSPLQGLRDSIRQLMLTRALDHEHARAGSDRAVLPAQSEAERAETLRLLERLVARARDAGLVRSDLRTGDVVMALTANDAIRARTPALAAAASHRFATLMLDGFESRAPKV